MPRPRAKDTEQDKIPRFERIKKAITALERQHYLKYRSIPVSP
ncbi:hypothetical protein [Nostoc sp. WHI]|nr:hypothetical protein [Nostoc sp. WHI]